MKKFHVGEYVRIYPHLEKMYPDYWLSYGMLKYAGMIVRVEKISELGEVSLGTPTKKMYVWHPALLEKVGNELLDGDKL